MDARSKRRLAHAEGGRHLFVSELLAVPEHDGLAHPVREAGERVAHAAPSLFEEELVNLARGRDAPRVRRALVVPANDAVSSRVIATAIAGRRDQPDH